MNMRQVTVHFAMRVLTESGSVDLWSGQRHRNDRGEGIVPQPEIYAVGCVSQNFTNWAAISLFNSLLGSRGNSLKQKRNGMVDRVLQVWLRHVASTARSRVALEKTQSDKHGETSGDKRKDQVKSSHCEKCIAFKGRCYARVPT